MRRRQRDGEDGDAEKNRNIIMLATDAPFGKAEFLARISGRVGGRVTVSGFEEFGRDLYEGPVTTDDVPLLTDAHAPTDSLIRVN